jgi:hypothetical protein
VADPIRIEVEFEGADSAARGARAVGQSLDGMAQRQRAAAQAAQAASVQFIALSQRVAGVASSISQLTSLMGSESQIGSLVGSMASGAAATAQLGAQFGPQGALVGGIIGAAIPALRAMMEASNEAADAARRQAEAIQTRQIPALNALVGQLTAARTEQEQLERVRSGRGSQVEQEAYLEQQNRVIDQAVRLRAALEDQRRALQNMPAAARLGANAMRALRDEASVEQEVRALDVAIARQAELVRGARAEAQVRGEILRSMPVAPPRTDDPPARGGGGRDRYGEEMAAWERYNESVQRGLDQERQARERVLALQIEQQRIANAEYEKAREAEAAELAAKRELERERQEAFEAEMERQDQLKAKLQEASREAEEAAAAQMQSIQEVSGVIVGGLTDALSAVIAGQQSAEEAFSGMLASFLAYISEQAALEAAMNFAQAISSFAQYKYDAGAQHLAAGIAFTAVAVAAGAGSMALSAPSQQSAAPEEGRGGEGSDGGGGQIVINWNSPVVTTQTRAELGREMGNMIRAGENRYGR